MNTNFVFYGDPALLEEIEAFFVSEGLNANTGIVRASEPKPGEKHRAASGMMTVIEPIAKVALAYLAFLEKKRPKLKLKLKTGDQKIEISNGDVPEKISSFVQNTKTRFFEIDLTL